MWFLSIIAAVVLIGHAVAIIRFRSLWPFDHYPMYSFPVARLRYPIVRGKQLTMFSLVEVLPDGTTRDLLSNAHIYPPDFHPFDRLEVVMTLLRSGLLERSQHKGAAKHFERETRSSGADLERALRDLLEWARTNRSTLTRLRLVEMTWHDFRTPSSTYLEPDTVQTVAEVSHE